MEHPAKPIRIRKITRAIDVRRALLKIVNGVLAGEIEPRVANAATAGLNVMMRSLEVELFEARIERLEEAAGMVSIGRVAYVTPAARAH